ncbi:MAG: hypothetical protein ACE141_06465 [Bryobacteraceae bacterium]
MSELGNAISEALKMVAGGGQTSTTTEIARETLPGLTPSFSDSVAVIARQLELVPALTIKQADAVLENTQALAQNTVAQKGSGVASVAGSIASTAMKTLGGGLGLVSLVSSIVGLFKGDKTEETPALTTYTAPSAVNFLGAAPQQKGQPILAVDYGQDGMPRTMSSAAPIYAPSVTVQVQAMDSRSFLDHSDDIARAVREAILNAHSLGDVVSEL